MITLRSMEHIKSAAGFTLLEALAATVLMAMILAALATITAQWLPNWNRGVVRVQGSDHIALAVERIVADLAAAELIPAGSNTRQLAFDGTDRSVVFVRTTLGPNAIPSLDLVRIAAVDASHGPALVRARLPFMPTIMLNATQRQPTFSDPMVLLRGPYRLSFAYAGADRVWHPTWRLQRELPKTIKITLQDSTAQRTRSISTAVTGYAKAPVECLVAKSMTDCRAASPQETTAADGSKSR